MLLKLKNKVLRSVDEALEVAIKKGGVPDYFEFSEHEFKDMVREMAQAASGEGFRGLGGEPLAVDWPHMLAIISSEKDTGIIFQVTKALKDLDFLETNIDEIVDMWKLEEFIFKYRNIPIVYKPIVREPHMLR